MCSAAGAEAPDYYIHKQTWTETMLASREALARLEEAGEIGAPLPDLESCDFTIAAWIKTESETGTILSKATAYQVITF